MDNTSSQMIAGLAFRHATTTAGGWLISHGYLQSDGLQGFVGACMIIGGVGWSWWKNSGQAIVAAELEQLKANRSKVEAVQARMAAVQVRMAGAKPQVNPLNM